jgi:hypothetical protein
MIDEILKLTAKVSGILAGPREIVVSSILPRGLRFETGAHAGPAFSFVVISPADLAAIERQVIDAGAYVQAVPGAISSSFNGLPVFDMDKADSGKLGARAAARALAMRLAVADQIRERLSQ